MIFLDFMILLRCVSMHYGKHIYVGQYAPFIMCFPHLWVHSTLLLFVSWTDAHKDYHEKHL